MKRFLAVLLLILLSLTLLTACKDKNEKDHSSTEDSTQAEDNPFLNWQF